MVSLADTQNCGFRRECRKRFPRQRGLAIPTCITARASRTCHDACRDRQLAVSIEVAGGENVPGDSRRMHHPQFYVSGKRPMWINGLQPWYFSQNRVVRYLYWPTKIVTNMLNSRHGAKRITPLKISATSSQQKSQHVYLHYITSSDVGRPPAKLLAGEESYETHDMCHSGNGW